MTNWTNTGTTEGSSIMGVLFIIIVIWAIFGGGFGNGFGGDRYDHGHVCGNGCISNCEVQKQEIIDSARTQYLIETTGNRTIDADNANTQRLYDQSARQYEAGLQEKLFDAKMNAQTNAILTAQALNAKDVEIATLKSEKYIDMRFDNLSRQVSADYNNLRDGQMAISCEMPKRPPYYAQGFINCGYPIPQNCGNNTFNC